MSYTKKSATSNAFVHKNAETFLP